MGQLLIPPALSSTKRVARRTQHPSGGWGSWHLPSQYHQQGENKTHTDTAPQLYQLVAGQGAQRQHASPLQLLPLGTQRQNTGAALMALAMGSHQG